LDAEGNGFPAADSLVTLNTVSWETCS